MAHDWVFDVLADLKTYATANGLPGLAAKADETLKVAAAEIAANRAAAQKVGPPRSGRTGH